MLAVIGFALLYAFIDIVYVLSTSFIYLNVVRKVQKEDTKFDASRIVGAVLAYVCIVVGWIFLVAPAVRQNVATHKYHPLLAGGMIGFVYGIALHGTYNLTNFAMFKNWTTAIVVQDIVWGTTLATAISAAYAWSLR